MKTTRQVIGSRGLAPSLHFRRWTRSHAAVFRSLGRCVVIGHLAVSVLEQLAGKSLSLLREWTALQLAYTAQTSAEEEAEASLTPAGLDELLRSSLALQAVPCSAQYTGSLSASLPI